MESEMESTGKWNGYWDYMGAIGINTFNRNGVGMVDMGPYSGTNEELY